MHTALHADPMPSCIYMYMSWPCPFKSRSRSFPAGLRCLYKWTGESATHMAQQRLPYKDCKLNFWPHLTMCPPLWVYIFVPIVYNITYEKCSESTRSRPLVQVFWAFMWRLFTTQQQSNIWHIPGNKMLCTLVSNSSRVSDKTGFCGTTQDGSNTWSPMQ